MYKKIEKTGKKKTHEKEEKIRNEKEENHRKGGGGGGVEGQAVLALSITFPWGVIDWPTLTIQSPFIYFLSHTFVSWPPQRSVGSVYHHGEKEETRYRNSLSLFRSLPFHSLYSFIHIHGNLRVDHSQIKESKHLIHKETRIRRSGLYGKYNLIRTVDRSSISSTV